MSRKLRICITLLVTPVSALLLLIVFAVGDDQAAFVFGLWAFLLLVTAGLVLSQVRHPLPWRLLGAAAFVGAVAYFACGYFSDLSLQDQKNGIHVALVGIVGAYFAIAGRLSPSLPKSTFGDDSVGDRPDEAGKQN